MKLLLLGATGLVGNHALQLALVDPRVSQVIAPVRRPLAPTPKLHAPVIDFENPDAACGWWNADAAICALGTTRRTAGSADAFRRVDHDMVLAVARLARQGGTPSFALVSAKGASPRSPFLYSRVKGETERAVDALAFPSLTILRPGLIGGERAERRPAERLAQAVLGRLGGVLPPPLRINPAGRIAECLLRAALSGTPGRHLIESGEMA